MRYLALLAIIWWLGLAAARPPPPKARDEPEAEELLEVEYKRYLQEVSKIFEEDKEFSKKLENYTEEQVMDGTIAQELEFAKHHIRSKLDEAKSRELERLRDQIRELGASAKLPEHVDLSRRGFSPDDWKRLIKETGKHFDEMEKKQAEAFERHEMEKKFEREQRLKHITNVDARKAEEARLKALDEKLKDHPKMKHPMTHDQLEDVWEKVDEMDPKDFDAKTFFRMHDLNQDGYLDEEEVKALVKREIDKAYDPKNPNVDFVERDREYERVWEHVYKEVDKDGDRMISLQEFDAQTKTDEFEKDPGWDTLDETFTDEDYEKFAKQRQVELDAAIKRGEIPDGYPYYGGLPEGAEPYHLPGPAGANPGQPPTQQQQQQQRQPPPPPAPPQGQGPAVPQQQQQQPQHP